MATTAPTPDRLTQLAAALATLRGAIVQQVRGPELDGVVQLALYRPDQPPESRRLLLEVWARDGQVGAWRTDLRRPNRTPQGSFTMFLRKTLVGQRLREVRALTDGVALGWARGDDALAWLVPWRGPEKSPPQLAWVDARGRCRPAWPGRADASLGARVKAAAAVAPMAASDAAAIETAARGRAQGIAAQHEAQGEGSALRRAVRGAQRREQRLVKALEGDLARASQAESLRTQGEVLKICLAQVPSGADTITLDVPWLPGETVTIALKRELSPATNLARIFRRARGFSRRFAEIEARVVAARARNDGLQTLLDDCDSPEADAVDLAQRAVELGIRAAQTAPQDKPTRPPTALPTGIVRYRSPAGAEVLLGKSAVANDKLVTRLARGRDIWMHVRGRTGAHLLLRHPGPHLPSTAELLACAALVAWGSGLKRGDRVEVTWTHARHVRKAKGSAPGLVYVSDEHTLYVDIDADIIDAFRAQTKIDQKP